MKNLFQICLFTVLLSSCSFLKNNAQEVGEQDTPVVNSELLNASQEKLVFIKDSMDYSARFITELAEVPNAAFGKVSLIDSFMILEENDTIVFPAQPEIGVLKKLAGERNGVSISLFVQRVNQTSIDYLMHIGEDDGSTFSQSGQADIAPFFFLGSETDTAPSGMGYLSSEFADYDIESPCYTNIRLGTEYNADDILLGKLSKNCNGNVSGIVLDECPNLVEQKNDFAETWKSFLAILESRDKTAFSKFSTEKIKCLGCSDDMDVLPTNRFVDETFDEVFTKKFVEILKEKKTIYFPSLQNGFLEQIVLVTTTEPTDEHEGGQHGFSFIEKNGEWKLYMIETTP